MSLLFNRKDIIPERKKKSNYAAVVLIAASAFVITTLTVWLIYSFYCFPYKISDVSMKPYLKEGDTVWVYHGNGGLKKDDIVLTRHPLPAIDSDNRSYLLRVAAGPGDVVKLTKKGLTINTKLEYKAKNIKDYPLPPAYQNKILLQDNQWYLLGDNWSDSFDSRHFGAVAASSIIGIAEK